MNFNQLFTESPHRVCGATDTLIRDGNDDPVRWCHNGYANPKNREMAFLLGRGYSATWQRRQELKIAQIPVMAINDYPEDGPVPRFWVGGDYPGFYPERIWSDGSVMKFSPVPFTKMIRPRGPGPWATSPDAPNAHFFHRLTDDTELDSWLDLPYIPWGTSIYGENVPPSFWPHNGAKCSMLLGIRLLWHLGYREIFLLGVDCAPHQHTSPGYWPAVFHLLGLLRPVFDARGLSVYQTNPDSHLRVFDICPFDGVKL